LQEVIFVSLAFPRFEIKAKNPDGITKDIADHLAYSGVLEFFVKTVYHDHSIIKSINGIINECFD